MDHIFFIHSSVEGHLGSSHSLPTVAIAAMSQRVKDLEASLLHQWLSEHRIWSVSLAEEMIPSALLFHVLDPSPNKCYQHINTSDSEAIPPSVRSPPWAARYLILSLPQQSRQPWLPDLLVLRPLGLVLQVQGKFKISSRQVRPAGPMVAKKGLMLSLSKCTLWRVLVDKEPSSESSQMSKLAWTGR